MTHLDYLIRRLMEKKQIESQNKEIFDEVKDKYADSVKCAERIKEYLDEQFNVLISDEELLYLSIHINRLISRIDDN